MAHRRRRRTIKGTRLTDRAMTVRPRAGDSAASHATGRPLPARSACPPPRHHKLLQVRSPALDRRANGEAFLGKSAGPLDARSPAVRGEDGGGERRAVGTYRDAPVEPIE